jgi:predicted RNA-binding Zn-ribbon protein involved in translation (DUF1610 family)
MKEVLCNKAKEKITQKNHETIIKQERHHCIVVHHLCPDCGEELFKKDIPVFFRNLLGPCEFEWHCPKHGLLLKDYYNMEF